MELYVQEIQDDEPRNADCKYWEEATMATFLPYYSILFSIFNTKVLDGLQWTLWS